MEARRRRVSGKNRRKGRWVVIGGDRIGQLKELEWYSGAVVVDAGRGHEASEAGQCPITTGSECLNESSLPSSLRVFAVTK